MLVKGATHWCLWCHCHLGWVRNQLSAYRWECCIISVNVNGNPPSLYANSSDLTVITTPRSINIRGILCSFAGTPLIYSVVSLVVDSLHCILYNMDTTLFGYIISSLWIYMMYLPISFRVTSLAVGQAYASAIAPCSASEDPLETHYQNKSCIAINKIHGKISSYWFNIKISSSQYRKSHCGDKMILHTSYIYN